MENKTPEMIDLSDTGLSDEELFTMTGQDLSAIEKIDAPKYSYWKSVWRVFFRKKSNIAIIILTLIILVFTYIYPMFSGFDKYQNIMDLESRHLTPSKAFQKFGFSIHWLFGTGGSGQSTFDGLWYGARISITIALICTFINFGIGILLGAVWGFSKRVDMIMNEVRNVVVVVPGIFVTSVLMMVLSPSFWTLIFSMTIMGWIGVAYSIRTQVIIIRDRDYNLASKCLGTSTFNIATKNILPFMISFIVTMAATTIPGYIGSEAFLSYIGLGISEMTLGKIMFNSQAAMVTPGWGWEFWTPVLLSSFISIVLFLIGQSLGDAADPRTHMI